MIKHTTIKTLITLILTVLTLTAAKAQVTVDARLDSAAIFIGQRIGMTLEVSADRSKDVILPQWGSLQQVAPGLEFVRAEKTDTSSLDDDKRMLLRRRYYFTAFDSALILIPELEVKVDSKAYRSKPLALKVVTFDIDTLHTDSIYPIKP